MLDGLCLVVIVYSSTGDDKVGAKGPMMGIVQPLLYKYNVLAYVGGHQHYLNVSMDYYHSIPYYLVLTYLLAAHPIQRHQLHYQWSRW